MKTINDLFVELETLLEDDPYDRIGSVRHAIVRQLRWDSIIVKFRIHFVKANLEINEEKGYIKFDSIKYGRLTYFPKADRIMNNNKWISSARNWLNKQVPDLIPKEEHFDVDTEYEIWKEQQAVK